MSAGTSSPNKKRKVSDENEQPVNSQQQVSDAAQHDDATTMTSMSSVTAAAPNQIPDEDHAAPPSSASGAHAKPLSALFEQSDLGGAASIANKRNNKGKAKRTDDDKTSFESVLSQLQESATNGDDLQVWSRPKLERIDPNTDAIILQQIDVEEFTPPGQGPQIRIYGVTEAGYSVMLHVTGFLPYFWVAAPKDFNNKDCQPLMDYLNNTLFSGLRPVHSISVANKRSLWGYKGDSVVPFLKITMNDLKHYPKVRNAFERGDVNFRSLFDGSATMTFESNIAYSLRFMIDHQIVGMNWIELPKGTYKMRSEREKLSNCQLEIDIAHHHLISHAPEGDWSKIAPLRILSFDIECAGRKGIFPEPEIDPVIQIANMVTRQGETKPFIRNVFTLNTCSHIVGTDVREFARESDMLLEWQKFVEECDPDLIIGYNTSQFDLPYLLDRAKTLKATNFPYLGRLKNVRSEAKETHFSSKAYGTRDSKETSMDGRLQLDILQVMQRDYKLRSYTLNSVCAHFLGEQKEDVHHSVITDLQNGNAESRRRLAVYCLKDAYLPQRLMDKLMCFVNYIEMARVTGIPFNYLLSRGQQIKVISQLYRKAMDTGYLIPALKQEGSDEQYEGATVIEPEKGYYDVPIATLDFASLYPSIMQAHNLCYTTLLDARIATTLGLKQDEDYVVTPNGDLFVTTKRRKGLLPTILQDLLSARKRARNELKQEKDPFKRAVLDGRQLALKISANSVYGFTGATIGKLPCLPISMSTTAYGREMIEKTKQEVQARYNTANGYEYDATVIYGDTDSVMVRFGCPDLKTAMELGAEAAEFVTSKFIQPIKLEFEKVYFPYLLISKKRYAGLYWTKPDKWDKMDTKGIETVRRDNCRLVVTVIETCLKKMLIDRDVKGAEDYTKQVISELLQNKIDLSQLVITKALAKADYQNKQAHVELAERMKKRDAGSAPALGDRVAYVIIKGTKDARAYEKSEDPLYVLENNVPIDTKYYLDQQLSKPLMRIFEPILGEKASSLYKAVCPNCRTRTAELYAKQLVTTSNYETAYARLWTQCQRCQGSLHQDVLCTSKDCPIFYMRKKAQKDVAESVRVLERFDGEW
ncbi:DNA-directed DNA polymerase delta [Microbotryomycetes sp. JL221]|nr:DNA-directed DNA polymerase delta [Microbotryomycetes sp. JL221]